MKKNKTLDLLQSVLTVLPKEIVHKIYQYVGKYVKWKTPLIKEYSTKDRKDKYYLRHY